MNKQRFVWHPSGALVFMVLLRPDSARMTCWPLAPAEKSFSILWLHWYDKMEMGCLFSLMVIIISVVIDMSLPALLSFPDVNYCRVEKCFIMVSISLQLCHFMMFCELGLSSEKTGSGICLTSTVKGKAGRGGKDARWTPWFTAQAHQIEGWNTTKKKAAVVPPSP